MSKIVLGTPTPHWASRVSAFLGNLGAQQRQQREIEEQQKQQVMQQEIERARQYVKNAADPNAALQQVPEALRPFVTYETYRDPMAEKERAIKGAQLDERAALYGGGQSQPQRPPFDFSVEGRVDAPQQPQAPAQSQESPAQQIIKNLLKVRDVYGDEAMKTAAGAIQLAALPDTEEMNALRVQLKTLVDAPTQYTQDSTTERTQMQQTGANHRTQVAANASRDVANINQGGATLRHTTPSADAKLKVKPAAPMFIDDTPAFKKVEASLTSLGEREKALLQEIAGSEEMLARTPAAVSEQEKLRRNRGILAMVRAQLDQEKGRRQTVVKRLEKAGLVRRDEYMTMTPAVPAGQRGNGSLLTDDMVAVVRSLDPSITEAELNEILNSGGFDE
jgi:hypothetical protein